MTAGFEVSFLPIMATLLLLWLFRPSQKVHFDIPPSAFWLIWMVFLALIIALVYAKRRGIGKRREELNRFAMESGLTYSETAPEGLGTALSGMNLVGFSINPRFSNVMTGNRSGCDLVIADRKVGGGKNQSTTTIVAVKSAEPIPSFMLCSENMLWNIADRVGYKDIDFEGAPEFSKRFFLHGDNVQAVRDFFTPEVIRAFEQLDSAAGLYASGTGNWLVLYKPGRVLAVQQIRDLLQKAETVADAFRSKTRFGR